MSVSDKPLNQDDPELPPRWIRVSMMTALLVILLVVPAALLFVLYQSGDLLTITRDHAAAMLGIPWAGGAALIVVLVLRSSFGRIEFKILGVQFEGASGPVIMWFLCFLVEVLAIHVLW